MKSEWKVTSQYINKVKRYQVYRNLNINAVDHSGNREYVEGSFYDRVEAENLAKRMNKDQEMTL